MDVKFMNSSQDFHSLAKPIDNKNPHELLYRERARGSSSVLGEAVGMKRGESTQMASRGSLRKFNRSSIIEYP